MTNKTIAEQLVAQFKSEKGVAPPSAIDACNAWAERLGDAGRFIKPSEREAFMCGYNERGYQEAQHKYMLEQSK